uniref:U650i n=1 Tax=Mycobacterium leprae TaxID=1769 RepID=Q50096_MYCLR|nr:u650i [Mycobacterium leprae]
MAVEHYGVDVADRDELQDLDLAAALLGQCGDVVIGDHHQLAFVEFVGLGEITVFDDLSTLHRILVCIGSSH